MMQMAGFARMARDLSAELDMSETLASICQLATRSVGCDHAGIHIVRHREIETGAATDPVVEHADKLQMEVDQGPCLDAIWEHDTFVVHDAATDPRWPVFGPMAASLGLHSILSVRLFTSEQTLGALNLYSTDVREFCQNDVANAHVFGQHASMAFATTQKEAGLRRAMDSRHLIGQAQGILMERFGLTETQAFTALRRYAQQRDESLTLVAAQLIGGRAEGRAIRG